ncbi:hypothetical protein JMJ35_010443 [Cladonia borealis]|uniref:FAD dependent oxidoreductase domain-containing protein n=1 Tax=Cladonia borealis TaxID=184061 RepID=A0AA39V640_9LECA|nr:hypothetical protein JMJ35_010443 [Cladonia borealis]
MALFKLAPLPRSHLGRTLHSLSPCEKVDLTIIGAGGAIGLPASYLASKQGLKVLMIDGGSAALDSSTHTVHTSIVRPNLAVWPFAKAVDSWLNNGPFDIRLFSESGTMASFGVHSILQSYFVSHDRLSRMWGAFRRLGLDSRQIYLDFGRELGPIIMGGKGRGHLASPLVIDDDEAVLGLRDKLGRYGVESEIITGSDAIQDYVGQLRVRHPKLMVRYPEDFVLDLERYKTQLLHRVNKSGGLRLQDTVVGLEQDSRGSVTAVVTESGQRIETDAVLYAGGWRAGHFLRKWLGINMSSHLNVASGVRFILPNHMVDRSIVCGSMFMAPGYDQSGNPVTDIGQMFLTNVTDTYPTRKHLTQALKRFHTYFDYQSDIPKIWNCVGRPITTTGMPFIEKVAPNMVVALGPGMFGVTLGTGLAQRGLDLLLHNKSHSDHTLFDRQLGWKIVSSFIREKLSQTELPRQTVSPSLLKTQRVLQLGRRGAMTTVLSKCLTSTYDFAVYGASQVEAVMNDIETHPSSVLLVASHGSQARLPLNYDKDYLSANEAIEKVLAHAKCKSLSGIVMISGGIPKAKLQELKMVARNAGVRFVHLPGLATSMEVLLKAVENLLTPFIGKPRKVLIEDTFHRGKREIPSAGGSQLLASLVKKFGPEQLLILTSEPDSQNEFSSHYPNAVVKAVKCDEEIQAICAELPELIPVVCRSYRIDVPYRYQHRLSLQGESFIIDFEQKVTDRAQLVPPISQVIEKLSSLPPGFNGNSVSSVVPVVSFTPGSSIVEGLAFIIRSLRSKASKLSVWTRQAEPDSFINELVTSASVQTTHIQHDPSLCCNLRIEAELDAQLFSISVTTS